MARSTEQDNFSKAFREVVTEFAQAAGLVVRADLHTPWLEEPGTYPEGQRGWWVSAGLKPQFKNPPDFTGRRPDELLPSTAWPAYVKVTYAMESDPPEDTPLLDVEIKGAGAHLVRPLAAMAVAAVVSYLRDRDTRIEALRERKGRLAEELETVAAELFALDGISD